MATVIQNLHKCCSSDNISYNIADGQLYISLSPQNIETITQLCFHDVTKSAYNAFNIATTNNFLPQQDRKNVAYFHFQ